jgi:hypothetical protein
MAVLAMCSFAVRIRSRASLEGADLRRNADPASSSTYFSSDFRSTLALTNLKF